MLWLDTWRQQRWCTAGILMTVGMKNLWPVRWSGESIPCTGWGLGFIWLYNILFKVHCGEGQANWVLRTVRECVQGFQRSKYWLWKRDDRTGLDIGEGLRIQFYLYLLHPQDRIMLSDIADIRKRMEIPQEYYDYVNDSNAFSQVLLWRP